MADQCSISGGIADNYHLQDKVDKANEAINVYDVDEKFPVSPSL